MDAINKAFEILDLFLENEGELSIKDIASLTGIKASTAHRVTNILIQRGYLHQKQKRGKYSVSTKKLLDFIWIAKSRLDVRNIALPFLQDLSRAVNENAHINFKVGNIAYNTDVINSNHPINVVLEKRQLDLYSTSVGKIFLAHMSETELEEYLGTMVLEPRTANTITDVATLKSCLEKVRREGIAYDIEEHDLGIIDIASPVMDLDGTVVAAAGVISPSMRMNKERMTEIGQAVKKCSSEISAALGYRETKRK